MTTPGRVHVADAASGDVWESTPTEGHLLHRANLGGDSLLNRIVRTEVVGGNPRRSYWWSFPRVVLMWPVADSSHMLMWSESDSNRVLFVRLARQGLSEHAHWTANVVVAKPFDTESLIVLSSGGSHGASIGRVRLPTGVYFR